jgi:nicotinate-nucleotide adenylyltransferase
MLQAMASVCPFLQVDDRELRRPGPSYTIDTIESLLAENCGPVMWIVGADQWQRLPTWHRLPDLLTKVHWLVFARPGSPLAEPAWPSGCHATATRLELPPMDISSSGIRQMIASHDDRWQELVTPEVAGVIRQRGLYGAKA